MSEMRKKADLGQRKRGEERGREGRREERRGGEWRRGEERGGEKKRKEKRKERAYTVLRTQLNYFIQESRVSKCSIFFSNFGGLMKIRVKNKKH